MKEKTKIVALLEVAVVLCSVFLVAPAVLGAERAAGSGDDFVLGIYGNANEDGTIDMRDITYAARIILWLEEETELADANNDGRVSVADMTQIGLIILGRESELTIVDAADRIVTVKKPVERIVVMNTEGFETIRTLQATDRVVGVSRYIVEDEVFYPGFSDYPNIGTPWSIDYEVLLECEPDLVFTYTKYPKPQDLEEKIEGTGIVVLRFDFNKLPSFVQDVTVVSYVLGERSRAEEFIEFYNEQMQEIEEKVEQLSEEEKPKVYLEADFGAGKKYYTCGKGHGHHQLLVAAGGKNIFDDVEYGKDILAEEVIYRNPEIIAKYKYPAGGIGKDVGDTKELEEIRDEILGREELQHVTAVEEKKVFVFTWYTTRGAARYFLGIGYLAKWFHPELFEDLDPRANYQEYLTRFQGLEIDLEKQGVFAYPEPS